MSPWKGQCPRSAPCKIIHTGPEFRCGLNFEVYARITIRQANKSDKSLPAGRRPNASKTPRSRWTEAEKRCACEIHWEGIEVSLKLRKRLRGTRCVSGSSWQGGRLGSEDQISPRDGPRWLSQRVVLYVVNWCGAYASIGKKAGGPGEYGRTSVVRLGFRDAEYGLVVPWPFG